MLVQRGYVMAAIDSCHVSGLSSPHRGCGFGFGVKQAVLALESICMSLRRRWKNSAGTGDEKPRLSVVCLSTKEVEHLFWLGAEPFLVHHGRLILGE
jgi:hypothetical protein